MSFNGAGIFLINTTGNPVVTGTTISSTWLSALTADLATGLTTCITRDGQSPATANIPFGGFKATGIGLATATGDALSYGRNATVANLAVTGTTSFVTITASGLGTFGSLTVSGAVSAGSLTVSGATSSGALTLTAGATQTGSTKQSVTAVAALNLDLTTNDFFTKSISTNSTFTFSGATASTAQAFILQLTISSAAVPTWPASVTWANGSVPTLGNGIHVLGFLTFNGGTAWRAILGGAAFA